MKSTEDEKFPWYHLSLPQTHIYGLIERQHAPNAVTGVPDVPYCSPCACSGTLLGKVFGHRFPAASHQTGGSLKVAIDVLLVFLIAIYILYFSTFNG